MTQAKKMVNTDSKKMVNTDSTTSLSLTLTKVKIYAHVTENNNKATKYIISIAIRRTLNGPGSQDSCWHWNAGNPPKLINVA